MSDQDQEITMKAIRTNWPVLMAGVIGLIAIVRGEMTVQQNIDDIRALQSLVSVEGISEYSANMAVIQYRLNQMEASCR
jgi:hypothetical protein